MIEIWKQQPDKANLIGVLLMDLLKAINIISHSLRLTKLEAYNFHGNSLKPLQSYLISTSPYKRFIQ